MPQHSDDSTELSHLLSVEKFPVVVEKLHIELVRVSRGELQQERRHAGEVVEAEPQPLVHDLAGVGDELERDPGRRLPRWSRGQVLGTETRVGLSTAYTFSMDVGILCTGVYLGAAGMVGDGRYTA